MEPEKKITAPSGIPVKRVYAPEDLEEVRVRAKEVGGCQRGWAGR